MAGRMILTKDGVLKTPTRVEPKVDPQLAGSVSRLSEPEIVELLKKHGITTRLGERYSVRCQIGQIINVVRELEKKPND